MQSTRLSTRNCLNRVLHCCCAPTAFRSPISRSLLPDSAIVVFVKLKQAMSRISACEHNQHEHGLKREAALFKPGFLEFEGAVCDIREGLQEET